ncbi:MAG: DUF6359 domain-containing protein [Paenibacillus sp.]|jgi:DNA/RNA endonuclease YhcR with UshA esterase domain|nr:DUF6359 domain-containing protein [Paenibacillus sp.]MDR0268192.1 DUF6359 domain-containing protein [Paenibacillus sp.]
MNMANHLKFRNRKLVGFFFAFVLVLSSVFGCMPAQADASVLTVAEAIAKNNSGETATVEGYIVGEVYNSKLVFSNFQDDLNVLIADTPGETNKSKLIDVQVSASFRPAIGLKSNPANLGKKLHVTGTLTAYSGMNGVKNPTAMSVSGESGGGDPGTGGTPDPKDPGSENIGVPTTLPDGTGKKVLFDQSHAQTAGAADWVIDGAFSDFADGLRNAKFQVDVLERKLPMNAQSYDTPTITLNKLKQYDVFIISEANIPFKASEQDAMLQYVKEGGSIFFISDHYNSDRNLNRWDSSEVMNGYRRGAFGNPTKGMSAEEAASGSMKDVTSSDWLGQNFGVRFRYNSIGDVTKTDTVKYDQSFGITAGVNDVEMHAGSTLVILDPKRVKGVVFLPKNVPGWSNAVENSDKKNFPNGGVYQNGGIAEGPYAAISKLEKGKAAFIGDSSPVEDSSPAYVREDNGGKKTTFDGFKDEGQDGVFLVQTVEWLAVHENYSTFENQGITLDASTPLLGALEEPATSAEIPGTEPWTTPAAGYKWYDPSTYKAGSYGSGKEGPVVTIPDLTTIASARAAADNNYVTVQGVITSEPGIFGGSGFYLQDGTAGIYVYPGKAAGYHVGDKIKITAQKTVYNSEVELMNDVQFTKLDDQTNIPAPAPIVQDAMNASNQGQLITLKNATVRNYAIVTGSLEFDLVNGNITNHVRVDSRTGISADTLKTAFPEGTNVDITGISSIFKNNYQLKLLNLADIRPAETGAENHPPVFTAIDPQTMQVGSALSFKVQAVDPDQDSLVYTAVQLPDGANFDPALQTFSWTPQKEGSYTASFKVEDGKGGSDTLHVRISVTSVSTGEENTAILTGPASVYAGAPVDLAVGVSKLTYPFTAMDVTIQYDPSRITFDTVTNQDGNPILAETAVTSSRNGLSVLAAGVKPDAGQIRLLLASTGEEHAVKESGELFKLHGKLKADASGYADLSLSSFTVSLDGSSQELGTSATSVHMQIVVADHTALLAAIQDAQKLADQAVTGTKPGQYPPAAKADLLAAIQAANAVYNHASATQEQINSALAALTQAVNTFRNSVIPIPSMPADKSALTAAIATAQNIYDHAAAGDKIGQYPAAAKLALQAAIQSAVSVNNSSSVSQSEVDAAVSALNSAVSLFQSKLITLVPGAGGKISVQDLSIIAKYYGIKSTDSNWSRVASADLFNEGEITIRSLAGVAQMIIGDWYNK